MESRFLLDIVVRKSAPIFELLSGKDQSLLIRRDAFLVLDFGLDVVNRIGRLHIECDGLSREGLYEYLHDLDKNCNRDTTAALLPSSKTVIRRIYVV